MMKLRWFIPGGVRCLCVVVCVSVLLLHPSPGVADVDISVGKSVDNPAPDAGSNITYTIVVSNAGPDAATGVEVLDLLPTGVTYNSSTPLQGAYDAVSGM